MPYTTHRFRKTATEQNIDNYFVPILAFTAVPTTLADMPNTRFVVQWCGLTAVGSALWAASAASGLTLSNPGSAADGLTWQLAQQVPAPAPSPDALPEADLEQLLGPIALYPDKLLANVLAAAIYPDDIAKAASYMSSGGNTAGLATQGLEPAVQDVAALPEVLNMLSQNPQWTAALGQAYLAQSQDVMQAVQILRQKANANGALVSNPQMTVVQQGSTLIQRPAATAQ